MAVETLRDRFCEQFFPTRMRGGPIILINGTKISILFALNNYLFKLPRSLSLSFRLSNTLASTLLIKFCFMYGNSSYM